MLNHRKRKSEVERNGGLLAQLPLSLHVNLYISTTYVHYKLSHSRQQESGHSPAGKSDSEFILPYFSP